MASRAIRTAVFTAAIAILAAGVGQPVLADTELGHTGIVGVHSLRDSSLEYGAGCKYKYLAGYDFGKLKHIEVWAPRVRAVAGKTAQLVGWRFTVQRQTSGLMGSGPWHDRYTSPEMTATTSDAAYASFSGSMSVRVSVPYGPDAEDVGVVYRVYVTMLWHRPNGSIQGTARHRVNFYGSYYTNAAGAGFQHNVCGAYWSPDW